MKKPTWALIGVFDPLPVERIRWAEGKLRLMKAAKVPGKTYTFPEYIIKIDAVGSRIFVIAGSARSYFFLDAEDGGFTAFGESASMYPYSTLGTGVRYKASAPYRPSDFVITAAKRLIRAKHWGMLWAMLSYDIPTCAYLKDGWEASTVGTDVLVVDTAYIKSWANAELSPEDAALYVAFCDNELAPFTGAVNRDPIPMELLLPPDDVTTGGAPSPGGLTFPYEPHNHAPPSGPFVPEIHAPTPSYYALTWGAPYTTGEDALALRQFRDVEFEFLYSSLEVTATSVYYPNPSDLPLYYTSYYREQTKTYLRRIRRRMSGYTVVSDTQLTPQSYGVQQLQVQRVQSGAYDSAGSLVHTLSPSWARLDNDGAKPTVLVPTARRRYDNGSAYFAGNVAFTPNVQYYSVSDDRPVQLLNFNSKLIAYQPRDTWTGVKAPDVMDDFTDPVSGIRYMFNANGLFTVTDTRSDPPGQVLYSSSRPSYPGFLKSAGDSEVYTDRVVTNSYDTITYLIDNGDDPDTSSTFKAVNHNDFAYCMAATQAGLAYARRFPAPLRLIPGAPNALVAGFLGFEGIYMPEYGAVALYDEIVGNAGRPDIRDGWVTAYLAGDKAQMKAQMTALIDTYTLAYKYGAVSENFLMGGDIYGDYFAAILI